MMKSRVLDLSFGVSYSSGGVSIATEEMKLNGFSMKPGNVSPRTIGFFAAHGGQLTDDGKQLKLVGGTFSATELRGFVQARDQENKYQFLKNISEPFTEANWKFSEQNDSFWLRIPNDVKTQLTDALEESSITFTCKKVQNSSDRCLLIKNDDLVASMEMSGISVTIK